MSDRARNRPTSKTSSDEWLSPPELVEAAGPFDLDPCVARNMPWRTARKMVSNKPPLAVRWARRQPVNPDVVADGLALEWHGAVFLNPPYSDILPWVEKLVRHAASAGSDPLASGILIVPAKSTDTRWGQLVLETMWSGLFLKGRLSFHHPSGEKSGGGWGPSLLAAFGPAADERMWRVKRKFPGVRLTKEIEPS